MRLTPRHLAATQYTITAAFMTGSWLVMLLPLSGAADQLAFVFSPENENRNIFIWLAGATLLTVLVALAFWFERAAAFPFAPLLVVAALALLAWAVYWTDVTFIAIFLLGFVLSIWSWWKPDLLLNKPRARLPQ